MTGADKDEMRDRSPARELAEQAAEMADQTAEMIGEVTKVLGVQRWQVREGPFQGFRSPPGRF